MNKPDPFEQELQQQRFRRVPSAWREEILKVAREAATQKAPPTSAARDSTAANGWKRLLADLLWPHPAAWGGLAATWLVILVLNFASRDQAEQKVAYEAPPASPELRELLREQQQMFADLIGPLDKTVATEPKRQRAQPRSAARAELLNA